MPFKDLLGNEIHWDSGGSASPNLLNLTRGGNPDSFLNTVALNRDLDASTNTVIQNTSAPPKITQAELQAELELIENNTDLSINEKANKTVDLINSTAITYGLNDAQRLNALQATLDTF